MAEGQCAASTEFTGTAKPSAKAARSARTYDPARENLEGP